MATANCIHMKYAIQLLILMTFEACSQHVVIIADQNYIDSDLDGLHDSRDACPHEAGSLFNMGCPNKENKLALGFNKDESTDSDLDGIPDGKDNCPLVYGSPFNQGCPMTEINH